MCACLCVKTRKAHNFQDQTTHDPPTQKTPTHNTHFKKKEKKAQGQMNTYCPFPDKYRPIHSIHFRLHRTGRQHCSLSCFSDTHRRPPHFLKALVFFPNKQAHKQLLDKDANSSRSGGHTDCGATSSELQRS